MILAQPARDPALGFEHVEGILQPQEIALRQSEQLAQQQTRVSGDIARAVDDGWFWPTAISAQEFVILRTYPDLKREDSREARLRYGGRCSGGAAVIGVPGFGCPGAINHLGFAYCSAIDGLLMVRAFAADRPPRRGPATGHELWQGRPTGIIRERPTA